jgi:hypothetical protein
MQEQSIVRINYAAGRWSRVTKPDETPARLWPLSADAEGKPDAALQTSTAQNAAVAGRYA